MARVTTNVNIKTNIHPAVQNINLDLRSDLISSFRSRVPSKTTPRPKKGKFNLFNGQSLLEL